MLSSKLTFIDLQIWQSAIFADPFNLQYYYHNLQVISSTFFDNALLMRFFDFNMEWFALGKSVDRDACYDNSSSKVPRTNL